MTKLTPVKRVDKNGVLTTKHVRIDTQKQSPSIPLPAPTIGPKSTTKVSASTVQKRWRVNKNKWGACDDELKYLCTEVCTSAQTYECSDAEAYDVMSVVYPENALPLLAIGIRTAATARQFLDETGVSRLKVNTEKLAEAAIERGIPAREFLEFSGAYHRYVKMPRFIDAAECWADPVMKRTDEARSNYSLQSLKPLRELILNDEIAWSDIQDIGIKRVASMAGGADQFVDHLIKIKEGTSGLKSVGEMIEVLDRGNPSIDVDIADVYGIEGFREIDPSNRWNATKLMEALRERDHSKEERLNIFKYCVSVGLNPEPKAIIALYEAGISAEESIKGIIGDLTTNQIIALNSGEVASSISSGYL